MKNSTFCLLFFFPLVIFAKTIEVLPSGKEEVGQLFAKDVSQIPIEKQTLWQKFQLQVEQMGYSVRSTDLEDVPFRFKRFWNYFPWMRLKKGISKILVMNLPYYIHSRKIFNLPREKLVLFMLEPPVIVPNQYEEKISDRFAKIYTWHDDLVDNVRYFKMYMPAMHPMIKNIPEFEDKKFCCLINANKYVAHEKELYSLRRKAIEFFEHLNSGEFDLYGYGWESMKYHNFRSSIKDKMAVLKQYKFCICFENDKSSNGCITEKIFDCFSAGCVPIYLGAPNVHEYIPKTCFIDFRNFSDFRELYDYLKGISEKQYNEYLKNIKTFLESDQAKLFSEDSFVKTLIEAAST